MITFGNNFISLFKFKNEIKIKFQQTDLKN